MEAQNSLIAPCGNGGGVCAVELYGAMATSRASTPNKNSQGLPERCKVFVLTKLAGRTRRREKMASVFGVFGNIRMCLIWDSELVFVGEPSPALTSPHQLACIFEGHMLHCSRDC